MKNLAKPRLDAKTQDTRQRLSSAYENLIKSVSRTRLAAEEMNIEKKEDEGGLATISHDREILYNLHEGDFARLRLIQEAIKTLDRGQYGECVRCEKDIDKKRLKAVPWAAMCIRCQEETEAENTPSRMVRAGPDAEETEL